MSEGSTFRAEALFFKVHEHGVAEVFHPFPSAASETDRDRVVTLFCISLPFLVVWCCISPNLPSGSCCPGVEGLENPFLVFVPGWINVSL